MTQSPKVVLDAVAEVLKDMRADLSAQIEAKVAPAELDTLREALECQAAHVDAVQERLSALDDVAKVGAIEELESSIHSVRSGMQELVDNSQAATNEQAESLKKDIKTLFSALEASAEEWAASAEAFSSLSDEVSTQALAIETRHRVATQAREEDIARLETELEGQQQELEAARSLARAAADEAAEARAALSEQIVAGDTALAEDLQKELERTAQGQEKGFEQLQADLDSYKQATDAAVLALAQASADGREQIRDAAEAALKAQGETLAAGFQEKLESAQDEVIARLFPDFRTAEPWKQGGPAYKAAAVVRHDNGLWQTPEDNRKAPAAENGWFLLVDGVKHISTVTEGDASFLRVVFASGLTFDAPADTIQRYVNRGTYDPNETYAKHDRVIKDGSSWVATAADPTAAPGEDPKQWELQAMRGQRGQRGQKGDRGDKGERGPAWSAADIVKTIAEYLAAGDGVPLGNFRGLWAPRESYVRSDVARVDNTLMLCVEADSSGVPPLAASGNRSWIVLMAMGGGGGGGGGSGGGHVIQDNGTPLTQRTGLNFIGGTVTDDEPGDRTNVFLPTGGQGFAWQGAWVDATVYNTNDQVESGGSEYVATMGHTASPVNEPGVGASWQLVWALYLEKGDKGDTGDTGPQGAQGPQGDTGLTGGDGADGVDGKTWHNGSGPPGVGVGVEGDFYMDTLNDVYYGPKLPGAWGVGTSLVGPQGADGAAGADGKTWHNGSGAPSAGLGVDGDFYLDTTNDAYYGPKAAGLWGSATSLIGPPGPAGVGVATGGTTGQSLVKQSGTNYDTAWADRLADIADDASPDLGGPLRTMDNPIEITDGAGTAVGGIVRIVGGGGQSIAMGYAPNLSYAPGDGVIEYGPGFVSVAGASVIMPTLAGADDLYQLWVTAEGQLYSVAGPTPGWQQSDTDNGAYLSGAGTGPGPWVRMTGLEVTLGQDITAGERIHVKTNLSVANVTTDREGTINVGFGFNGVQPASGTNEIIPGGFDGTVVTDITTTTVTATSGDLISVWIQRQSGSHASFGVNVDGSTEVHELLIYMDSEGGGGGGGVSDGDKGDITVSVGGTVWEINAGAVGNAERADSPAWSLSGRNAGTAGIPQDIGVGDVAEQATPSTGFKLLGWDGTTLSLADVGNLPTGGGGEINTGLNVGTGASVAVLDGANVGLAIPMRGINAKSARLSVEFDTPNKNIDLDVVETAVDHDLLLNYDPLEHVNWASSQASNVHANNIPQATEIARGGALIASQAEADAGTDDLKFLTPAKLDSFARLAGTSGTNTGDNAQASSTVAGIAEIATQGEVDAGADNARFVTPLTLENFGRLAGTSGTNTGDESAATTVTAGVIEIATQPEVDAGTEPSMAVTPATLAGYVATLSYAIPHAVGLVEPAVGIRKGIRIPRPGVVIAVEAWHTGALTSVTIMPRKSATANGATTDILNTAIVSTAAGATSVDFADSVAAPGDYIEFNITAVGGTPAATDTVVVQLTVQYPLI